MCGQSSCSGGGLDSIVQRGDDFDAIVQVVGDVEVSCHLRSGSAETGKEPGK